MPSIPQSLLWISLVVLWLFVLVPMLISKRDAVRRTSDVALATRVLNGAGSRLLRRSGPAAGHRSDPDWTPEEDAAGDELAEVEHDDDDAETEEVARPVVVQGAATEEAGPDYLDVDVIEDSGALPVGAVAEEDQDAEETEPQTVAERAETDAEDADLDDRYEYVEDSSGLEPEADREEDEDPRAFVAAGASRRRRFDPKAAAAVSARKFAFRKRVVMVMAVVLIGSATAAFEVSPTAWWG